MSPPAPGPDFEVPEALSSMLAASSITLFAYLTPRGEPLCWPVTPYWYPERGVLGVATGLAYPNKARYARRHPRVSALFGAPGGLQILLQGEAAVLDDDLQANTDRYVREMRGKFRSARLALNPLTVKLLDFYLPRLWIEITPHRLVVSRPGAEPVVLGTPQAPPAEGLEPSQTSLEPTRSPAPDLQALLRWVRTGAAAAVAVAGPDGYPAIGRSGVAIRPGGQVALEEAPGTGPATLTFHSQRLGGVRLDALMARGRVEQSDEGLRFIPRRVVGFLGTDPGARLPFLSIFPLSQLPRAAALRENLARELARRGEPLPRLRVPH
jgi:hypothetical protein